MEPQSISLKVFHQFKGAHSLVGFEQPHFHLWKITVEFKTAFPLKTDRVVDLIYAQTEIEKITAPLAGTYLNESMGVSPTSENMAYYLWTRVKKAFPNDPLHSISISLCNLDGEVTGEATLA